MNFWHETGSGEGFMPHGMCYLWRPGILALHVISDALITLSYFSIPFTLLYFAALLGGSAGVLLLSGPNDHAITGGA